MFELVSGALVVRGIMTGSNPGGYIVGVNYPKLLAIESNRYNLGTDAGVAAFANQININMLSLVRLNNRFDTE